MAYDEHTEISMQMTTSSSEDDRFLWPPPRRPTNPHPRDLGEQLLPRVCDDLLLEIADCKRMNSVERLPRKR